MNTDKLPVVELFGSPRDRGRIYGETMRELICNVIVNWKEHLCQSFAAGNSRSKFDPDQYINEFISQTNFQAAIGNWSPSLLMEIEGIAEGADQSFEYIFGLQLFDEEWRFGISRGLTKPTNKCTAFGISTNEKGYAYAGQNMDVGKWLDGYQVLLRILPEDKGIPEALVFTTAGNIGLNGMNSKGLGVTCNTLSQLPISRSGLPVSFIVRSLLQVNNMVSANSFLKNIKHASGQNYILSSFDGMECYECGGASVRKYNNSPFNRVFHTNHSLFNLEKNSPYPCNKELDNSRARLRSIDHRLGDHRREVSLKNIKVALGSHDDARNPVCRHSLSDRSNIGFTAGSSIYELGLIPRLYLASGPPCQTDFETFDFKTFVLGDG